MDYGYIYNVPKAKLRYLKREFCQFPRQAVHCCLHGYNELEKFENTVTADFLKLIDNKPVRVQIDKKFNLVSFNTT